MLYIAIATAVALLLGFALVRGRSRTEEPVATDSAAQLDLDPYLDSFVGKTLKIGGKVYQVRDPEAQEGFRLALELKRFGDVINGENRDPQDIERRLVELRRLFASVTGIPLRTVMKLPLPALLEAASFIYGSPVKTGTGSQEAETTSE